MKTDPNKQPQTRNPKPETQNPNPPLPPDILNALTNLPPGATIELKKSSSGDIILNGHSRKTKQQLIDENYSHLVGVGISLSEAAEKYGVPRSVIEGWVYSSGNVSFVDETVYPKLVDEAEVALCADIYKERRAAGTSGLPYFDEEGYLIEEVQRPASSRRPKKK